MKPLKPSAEMPAQEPRTITIFLSWQSDTPAVVGRNAIRTALRKASKQTEKKFPGIKLLLDEATRDVTGGINIATKIIEKLLTTDIIVADVTTITPAGAARPCPNPNVSYELGFGVGEIGWDRIILLFNAAIGKFPSDLPFDLIQNRTLVYAIKEGDEPNGIEKLSMKLTAGISEIVRADPKRPAQLRGLSREKVEHDRDVEQIRWLLSKTHLPTLDEHIDHLPDRVWSKHLWFHAHFGSVETNSLFSIYDTALNESVKRFARAWDTALSHGEEYRDASAPGLYVFRNIGDMPFSEGQEKAWNEIEGARTEMRQALDDILARVRKHYHEIKIKETNAEAWKAYCNEVLKSDREFKIRARNRTKANSSRRAKNKTNLLAKARQRP